MSDSQHDDDRPVAMQIRPIEEESVRRIVAGQAVTDLASAVKELVDNALDADSHSINIRLFNQGIDILEVTDDGCGVPPASRPYIAIPHATSKIRSFEDIYQDTEDGSLTTLGFRGEALFCLANLSEKLMVATRTAEEPMAQKMEFKRDGTMDESASSVMHRKVGTTVAVMKLLAALPVRRADMIRRIHQQRGKLLRMMEGYAIFSVGVRISLMDMVVSGGSYRENPLLTTSLSSNSVEENISSVMGIKFLQGLSRITVDLSSCFETESNNDKKYFEAQLQGFVSNAQPQGAQRRQQRMQTRVRTAQFFSINGRPVELPQVSRAINDAWRPFAPASDTKKRPSCVFCFTLPNSSYDINLSPEKRQVLLTKEKEICQLIQEAITQLWQSQTDGKFTQNDVPIIADNISGNKRPFECAEEDLAAKESKLLCSSPDSRKRHRRRHAFVHDFNNAKMQHEHEAPTSKKTEAETEDAKISTMDSSDMDKRDGAADSSGQQDAEHESEAESKTCEPASPSEQEVTKSMPSESCKTGSASEHLCKTDLTAPGADEEGLRRITPHQALTPPPVGSRRDSCEKTVRKVSNDKFTSSSSESTDEAEELNTISPLNSAEIIDGAVDEEKAQSADKKEKLLSDRISTSDAERRRWIDIQAKFNRSCESKQDEIQCLNGNLSNQVSPDDHCLPVPISKTKNSVLSEETPKTNTSINNKNSLKDDSQNKNGVFNLERFAFRRVSNDNIGGSKAGASPDDQRSQLPLGQGEDSACQSKASSDNTRESISQKIKTSSYSTQQLKKDTDEPHVKHTKYTSSPNTKALYEGASERQSDEDKTPSQEENDETMTPNNITWESFQGTKNVVVASRLERLNMREYRKQLREIRKVSYSQSNEKGTNDGDNKGVLEDVGEDTKAGTTVTLSKGRFSEMTVIGQFNIGFILAKCRNNHLWILDQHACDEKFNFERLIANTAIHEQKLIAPMSLELSPSEETCILDHMEIFEKNGFRFSYDPDKEPRHRLSLTALPHSGASDGRKAVQFGKEDVSALCAILGADGSYSSYADSGGGTGTDGSGMHGNNAVRRYAGTSAAASSNGDTADKIIKRLPKAVAMFASRACRGSIMIGTALSQKEMEKLVKRMDAVEQPWSCAHGRPTMSHVGDLQNLLLQESKNDAEHIAGPTVTMMTQMTQQDCADDTYFEV